MKNKFVIILLVLIAFLQIIPVSACGTDGYDDVAQNAHASIRDIITSQDQVLINNETRPSVYNLKSSRLPDIFNLQTYYSGSSLLSLNPTYIIIDIRDANKRTLSSYFYESKYRMIHTLI